MAKLSGLALIVTGVGVAVYSIPSNNGGPWNNGGQERAAEVVRSAPEVVPALKILALAPARPVQAIKIAVPAASRKFSADKPLLVAKPKPAQRPFKALVVKTPIVPKLVRIAEKAGTKPWSWLWPSRATGAAERGKSAGAPGAMPSERARPAKPAMISVPSRAIKPPPRQFADTKPADDRERTAVARDLQKELQRVGCYSGKIDGIWNEGSRSAMSAFNKRLNADLPVDEPDYILLTFVQGHFNKACGTPCGSGELLSNDGRCQPRAIQAARPRSNPPVSADSSLGRLETASGETGSAQLSEFSPARVELPARRAALSSSAKPRDLNSGGSQSEGGKTGLGGRLAAVSPSLAAPEITDTQIRTPSIAPIDNGAAKRAEAARLRAAANKRARERRRLAALARAEAARQSAAEAAQQRADARRRAGKRRRAVALARADAERQAAADDATALRRADARLRTRERRQSAAAARANRQRQVAARAASRKKTAAARRRAASRKAAARRARKARNRRIASASSRRKSYLGAKKRRRTKKKTYRRRRSRSSWKGGFWASQGM